MDLGGCESWGCRRGTWRPRVIPPPRPLSWCRRAAGGRSENRQLQPRECVQPCPVQLTCIADCMLCLGCGARLPSPGPRLRLRLLQASLVASGWGHRRGLCGPPLTCCHAPHRPHPEAWAICPQRRRDPTAAGGGTAAGGSWRRADVACLPESRCCVLARVGWWGRLRVCGCAGWLLSWWARLAVQPACRFKWHLVGCTGHKQMLHAPGAFCTTLVGCAFLACQQCPAHGWSTTPTLPRPLGGKAELKNSPQLILSS